MILKTDWCLIGFPKCGTTALAHWLDQSPSIHTAKLRGRWESPYFKQSNSVPEEDYAVGFCNGHKYSSYIYSKSLVKKIYDHNPSAIFIVCVRDPRQSLISWCNMHKMIEKNNAPKAHFVNKSEQSKNFYKNCTIEEYYEHYARDRLRYSHYLEVLLRKIPQLRLVVVSQARLSSNTRDVLNNLHHALSLEAPADYLDGLPSEPHETYGQRALQESSLPTWVEHELSAETERLRELLGEVNVM